MRVLGDEPLEALRRAEGVCRSDPIGALPLAAALEQAANGSLPGDLVARLALLRARAHHVRGEHFPALAQIRLAHREWITDGHPELGARAQLAGHAPFLALGEFDIVIDSARRIFADLASADLGPDGDTQLIAWHAQAHLDIGRAFDAKGETRPAMRHFDVAANLYQVLGDPIGVAETHAARGHTLLSLNMAHRAIEELTTAYLRFHDARLELPAHQTLVHLGRALLSQGRVSAAISLLQRTRMPLVLLGARGDVAELELALSSALLQAGLVGDAHALAQQASQTFSQLMMMQRSGAAELLRARVAHASGDLDAAEAALEVAVRLLSDCGARHLLSETLLAQARVAEQRGHDKEAVRLCRQVLAQESEDSPTLRAADAHLTLATLDEDASDQHLRGATEIAYAVGSSPLHLAISLVRARRHLATGNTLPAIEVLRRAERLASSLEHDESGAQTRVLRPSPLQETRDLLVDLLVDHGTHQSLIEAWACASAAKTSSVRHLARPAAQWRPEEEDDDGRFTIGPWPISPEEVRAVVGHTADSDRLPSPGLSAPVVPEGPLLEYHVLERDIIAFVVREGQVYVRRLRGAVAPSRRAVATWQQHCSLRGLGPLADRFVASDQGEEARAALAELRALLIDPLADLREDDGEEWLVVAHRHLHEVPMEAILTLEDREANPLQPVVAFGFSSRPDDQVTPADIPLPTRSPLILSVPDEAAPLIEDEASAIAAIFPDADLVTHEAATRERLLDDSAGRSLVHVVCHGVYRSRNPFYSALRLADGWVTARDLLHADLTGTLLVLSACDAGASSAHDHGPIGLAWAGLAAGARGVVAAMWPVEDALAARLMIRFYTELATSRSARHALARTRVALAAENADAHGWGAFRYFSASPQHVPTPASLRVGGGAALPTPTPGADILDFPGPRPFSG